MLLFRMLYSTFGNKCSRCNEGDVFKCKNPYNLKRMFEMHTHCSQCGLKYEKETSFFYGAMYVSYAISSGWFIIWYALQNYVLNWDLLAFAFFVSGFILAMSPVTLRWSRIIWLNFFYKYKKEFSKKNKSTNFNTSQYAS